ncbi:MAG: hypothetical protein KGQ58_07610 [Proteobacteria bacterium]|nr:hypothetical protein [Pseudomonadota bacterium]MDE3207251.1 hypothetical protein [Pseudomonadota bacterium]
MSFYLYAHELQDIWAAGNDATIRAFVCLGMMPVYQPARVAPARRKKAR